MIYMDNGKEEVKKKIDESWKETVQKEKVEQKTAQQRKEEFIPEKPDFILFISGLGMQVMMNLGEIPDPITKQKKANLKQAQYLIDTIEMLKNKTKGNLSNEEEKIVDELLYQLKMKYVEKAK